MHIVLRIVAFFLEADSLEDQPSNKRVFVCAHILGRFVFLDCWFDG